MKYLVTVEFPDCYKKDILIKAKTSVEANKIASIQLGVSIKVSVFCDSEKYWLSTGYIGNKYKQKYFFKCYASKNELKELIKG